MVTPELPDDLGPVLDHLRSTYPSEGCGVILRERDGGWRVRPLVNAYDRYHARDPERFPRTSRTAYFFDPKEWLTVYEDAEAAGDRVWCIFHSHCDAGAYFSAEDRAMAAPDGEVLFPGVCYLVVAVDRGLPTAARVYTWHEGDFAEFSIALPAR